MPRKNNPKITFDHLTETDLTGSWFELDKEFVEDRQEGYQNYKQVFRDTYSTNLTNQLFMTYTNIINLITKNAVVATIVMVIALGGMTTAAAQFFAPDEYKPSSILFPQDEKVEEQKPNVTNFEECVEVTGIVLESYPRQCIYEDQTFVEEISEEVVDPEVPEKQVSYKKCEHKNPNFSLQVPEDWECNNRSGEMNDNYLLEINSPEMDIVFSDLGRG